ncbi:MAG: hypothetical protein SFV17_10285 [Candidatus Obscuribacter sp.]|nr:hypothetical protein [Candidatus Obscuribacter sp.]
MKNNPRRIARQGKRAIEERYPERRKSSLSAQPRQRVSLPSANALRGIVSGELFASLDPEVYGDDD